MISPADALAAEVSRELIFGGPRNSQIIFQEPSAVHRIVRDARRRTISPEGTTMAKSARQSSGNPATIHDQKLVRGNGGELHQIAEAIPKS